MQAQEPPLAWLCRRREIALLPHHTRHIYRRANTHWAHSLSIDNAKLDSIYSQPLMALDVDNVENQFLLVSGVEPNVCLYDIDDTQTGLMKPSIVSLKRHDSPVTSIQWYPIDTGLFITSSFDGNVKLWDTNAFEPVTSFAFPQGTLHEKYSELHNDLEVYQASMSKNYAANGLIAAATASNLVRLCDIRTGGFTHVLRGHRSSIWCLDWAPNLEHFLVTGGADGEVLFWDIRRPGFIGVLDYTNEIDPVTNVNFIDTSDIERTKESVAHVGGVVHLKFMDDSVHLITSGIDCILRKWNVATAKNTLTRFCAFDECSIAPRRRSIGRCSQFNRFDIVHDHVLYSNEYEIRILRAEDGRAVNAIEVPVVAQSIVSQRDHGKVFAGTTRGLIYALSASFQDHL